MKPKEPHILCSDDDGHWYLVPESKRFRFEEYLNMSFQEDNEDGLFLKEFNKYRIDDPSNIKIFEWEEI